MNERKNTIEVSVLIPNYNYARYMEQCINSVIESDFDPGKLEIIIIDDRSTDKSVEIVNKIKETADTDIPILLVPKQVNSGLANTRNIGVENSKGSFLFFLDSDNYIAKDCIKLHYEFLQKHSDYAACFAPIQKFDDCNGNFLEIFSNHEFDYSMLKNGNYIDAMAMFRKGDLIEVGCYDEEMGVSGWEDYELWLKMGVNKKKVHFLNTAPLSYYRVHKQSMTNSLSDVNYQKLAAYIQKKYNIEYFYNGSLHPNAPENRINLNMFEISALKQVNVQVYWSTSGSSFSEVNSIIQQVELSESPSRTVFSVFSPDVIEYVRFDIGNQVGFIKIEEIGIKNKSGELIWSLEKNTFPNRSNVLYLEDKNSAGTKYIQLSTSADPQLIVQDRLADHEFPINILSIEIVLSQVSQEQLSNITSKWNKSLSFSGDDNMQLLQEVIQEKQAILIQQAMIADQNGKLLDEIEQQKENINSNILVIEEINKQRVGLEDELARKVQQLDESTRDILELKDQLDEVSQRIEKITSDHDKTKDQLFLKEKELEKRIGELEVQNNTIASLTLDVSKKEAQLKKLIDEVDDAGAVVKDLQKRIETIEKENSKLIDISNYQKEQIDRINMNLKDVIRQYDESQNKLAYEIDEHNKSKQELKNSRHEIQTMQLKMSELLNQVDFFTRTYENRNVIQIALSRLVKKK